MQQLKCSLLLVTLLTLSHTAVGAPGVRVKRQQLASGGELLTLEDNNEPESADLNPINAEEVLGTGLERNKRKLPDATFEAKNAVLGFVFGLHRRVVRAGGKDPNDASELSRENVSLELPEELFNKSFQTITNISKTVSRLIMNSARRYSRFVLFFKPMFGDALVVKGYEEPTTTTTQRTTTTTTTTAATDKLNEV